MFKSKLGGKVLDVASFVGTKRYRKELRKVNRLINEESDKLFAWSNREIKMLIRMNNAVKASNMNLAKAESMDRAPGSD